MNAYTDPRVTIAREFRPMTERYAFDFGPCSHRNGFAQIDTAQDASYFGQWANPTTRKLVSFAEGDVTFTTCERDEDFVAEVRRAATYFVEGGYGFAIDPMGSEEIKAAFERLGLGDLLH